MDLFNLFTKYHETTFQEFKKDLINSIKLDILNTNKNNKRICGHKRSQNRGNCRRLCSGNACKYHLKYVSTNDKNNIIENINTFSLKSDISDVSEHVNMHKYIYKNICENIISKNVLLNINILELPKSNIILKYNLNDDINNYIFNLKSKINTFKSLTSFIILYNKIKRKREKKRLKNKKKKERRKAKMCQTIISENKTNRQTNGLLLKEKDKYYTINFYDEKVIADNIEGIICHYCNTVRYTNSGPCLYPDCYNRSFEDTEFKIYYHKHGKHKESIYNPFILNS